MSDITPLRPTAPPAGPSGPQGIQDQRSGRGGGGRGRPREEPEAEPEEEAEEEGHLDADSFARRGGRAAIDSLFSESLPWETEASAPVEPAPSGLQHRREEIAQRLGTGALRPQLPALPRKPGAAPVPPRPAAAGPLDHVKVPGEPPTAGFLAPTSQGRRIEENFDATAAVNQTLLAQQAIRERQEARAKETGADTTPPGEAPTSALGQLLRPAARPGTGALPPLPPAALPTRPEIEQATPRVALPPKPAPTVRPPSLSEKPAATLPPPSRLPARPGTGTLVPPGAKPPAPPVAKPPAPARPLVPPPGRGTGALTPPPAKQAAPPAPRAASEPVVRGPSWLVDPPATPAEAPAARLAPPAARLVTEATTMPRATHVGAPPSSQAAEPPAPLPQPVAPRAATELPAVKPAKPEADPPILDTAPPPRVTAGTTSAACTYRVIDLTTNQPLAGARFELEPVHDDMLPHVHGQADPAGWYGASSLPPGEYQVTVRFPGYIPANQIRLLTAGVIDDLAIFIAKP